MRRRGILTVVATILFACWAVWFVWPQEDVRLKTVGTGEGLKKVPEIVVGNAGVERAAADVALRAEVSNPVDPEVCRIHVCYEDEGRASGASVALWARSTARVSASVVPLAVLTADIQGVFVVRSSHLADRPWEDVCAKASKAGFAFGWADRLAAGQDVKILLRPAFSIRFRCRLSDGAALPGVHVWLSQTQLFLDESSMLGEPLGQLESCVYHSISDGNGDILVDGLVAASYAIDIRHQHAILMRKLPLVDTIRIDAETSQDLVFVEPMVAACVADGSPLLFWVRQPHTASMINPIASFPSGVIDRLRRLAKDVSGNQNFRISLTMPREPWNNKSLSVVAYYKNLGWVAREVPYVKARDAAVVVVGPTQPVSDPGMGTCRIDLRTRDGAASQVTHVTLRIESMDDMPPTQKGVQFTLPQFVEAAVGSTLFLPCGDYHVQSAPACIGLEMEGEKKFRITSGKEVTVDLRESMSMTCISPSAMTTEGHPLPFFRIDCTCRVTGKSWFQFRSIAAEQFFLPVGEYDFAILAVGYKALSFPLSLREGAAWKETVVLEREG